MIKGGSLRANCPPVGMLRTDTRLNGVQRRALIDTGCSYTLVRAAVVGGKWMRGDSVLLETMDGKTIRTLGSAWVESLAASGTELGPLKVQVMRSLPLGMDIIIGLDVVLMHGLMVTTLGGQVKVKFCGEARKAVNSSGSQVRIDPALVGGVQCVDSAPHHSNPLSNEVIKMADRDYEAQFRGAK